MPLRLPKRDIWAPPPEAALRPLGAEGSSRQLLGAMPGLAAARVHSQTSAARRLLLGLHQTLLVASCHQRPSVTPSLEMLVLIFRKSSILGNGSPSTAVCYPLGRSLVSPGLQRFSKSARPLRLRLCTEAKGVLTVRNGGDSLSGRIYYTARHIRSSAPGGHDGHQYVVPGWPLSGYLSFPSALLAVRAGASSLPRKPAAS